MDTRTERRNINGTAHFRRRQQASTKTVGASCQLPIEIAHYSSCRHPFWS